MANSCFHSQPTVGLKLAVEMVKEVLNDNPIQPPMEALLAHFFSPHRPGYHNEDVLWFLEWANKQKHWCDNTFKVDEKVLNLIDPFLIIIIQVINHNCSFP